MSNPLQASSLSSAARRCPESPSAAPASRPYRPIPAALRSPRDRAAADQYGWKKAHAECSPYVATASAHRAAACRNVCRNCAWLSQAYPRNAQCPLPRAQYESACASSRHRSRRPRHARAGSMPNDRARPSGPEHRSRTRCFRTGIGLGLFLLPVILPLATSRTRVSQLKAPRSDAHAGANSS